MNIIKLSLKNRSLLRYIGTQLFSKLLLYIKTQIAITLVFDNFTRCFLTCLIKKRAPIYWNACFYVVFLMFITESDC